MKYMVLVYGSQQHYDALSGKNTDSDQPVWTAEDIEKMVGFMNDINQELMSSGEWVDGQGLTAPAHARRVQLQDGVPVVTDGPYAEAQEVIAGYWVVECASFDRATEIAAKVAQCPTPLLKDGSSPEYVDVRPVDTGDPTTWS